MTLAPFPLTTKEANSDTDAAVSGIIIVFYLGVGTSFIPALVTNFIVKEKETNIKHQQIVSGVSMTSYWVANFSLDYLKFLPFAILCPLILWLYNMTAMIDDGNFVYFIVLCLIFGWSIIMYSYYQSFKY